MEKNEGYTVIESRTAELHLTYRCDLACRYCNRACGLGVQHTPDMSAEQCRAALCRHCGHRHPFARFDSDLIGQHRDQEMTGTWLRAVAGEQHETQTHKN